MIPLPLYFIPKLVSSAINKPNLIFMHDLLTSAIHFNPIFSSLKHNSYFLDARNHGLSEHSPLMNHPLMSLDLNNFISSKKLANLVLIGHGMGGKTLMSFLNNYPEYEEIIKGVILLDIAPKDYITDRSFAWPIELWLLLEDLQTLKLNQTNYQKIKEKIMKIVPNKVYTDIIMHNIYQNEDPSNYKLKFNLKAIIENFKELNSYTPPAKGNHYKGKRLVIVGERSDYVPAKCFDSFNGIFHEFNKEKEVTLIKNAGHFIHMDQPKELMNLINEFIDGI